MQTNTEIVTPPTLSAGSRMTTRRSSKYGSRAKVFHGGAEMTSGGLRKDDLEKNKYGRIVSKKRSQTMKNRTSF
jgi:DVNP family